MCLEKMEIQDFLSVFEAQQLIHDASADQVLPDQASMSFIVLGHEDHDFLVHFKVSLSYWYFCTAGSAT